MECVRRCHLLLYLSFAQVCFGNMVQQLSVAAVKSLRGLERAEAANQHDRRAAHWLR